MTAHSTTKDSIPPEREFDHPLRALPWLRQLPNTRWMSILLTSVLAITCAAILTWLDPFSELPRTAGSRLWENLVYSHAVGFSIHILSEWCGPPLRVWLAKAGYAVRLAAYSTLWVAGVVLGFAIASLLLGHEFHNLVALYPMIVVALLIATVTGLAHRSHVMSELRAERERRERLEEQRALATTRLRLLQAQIEPHFLFNTLANVSSLIDADPKRARVMLDQFTLLLRALLDQTRQSATSLRKELQVAEAYLSVLKIRMGERLAYRIDVPSDLVELEVPAMLLQPIVENAVKHGIEPKMQGGMVLVSAARTGDELVLAVEDNGVGFVADSKESIGLGAIRERLAVQFGDHGRLEIVRTEQQWTRVAIHIPMSGKSVPSVST